MCSNGFYADISNQHQMQVVIQDHLEKGEGFAYILAKIQGADCTPRTQIDFIQFLMISKANEVLLYYITATSLAFLFTFQNYQI